MRPNLEALRTETANLFAEVQELKARWFHLEEAQADVLKVGDLPRLSPSNLLA